jgi:hypothetical protein
VRLGAAPGPRRRTPPPTPSCCGAGPPAQRAAGAARRRPGSVWRLRRCRRGGAWCCVLPGVARPGCTVPWDSCSCCPGLVAAGAGCCSASTPSPWTPRGRSGSPRMPSDRCCCCAASWWS